MQSPDTTRNDTILSKYTDSGNLMWKAVYPNRIRIQKAVCAPDSSIYVCGAFMGTMSIAGSTVISNGMFDICIVKFDNNGVFQWIRSLGTMGDDIPSDICIQGINPVVTASGWDTLKIGSSVYTGSWNQALYRSYLLVFDPSGNLQNTKFIPPASSIFNWVNTSHIEADSQGNIYTFLNVHDSVVIDNHLLLDSLSSTSTYSCNFQTAALFLVKLNPQLQTLWVKRVASNYSHNNGQPSWYKHVLGVKCDSQNRLWFSTITSSGTNTTSIPSGTYEVNYITPSGGNLSPNINVLGLNRICPGSVVSLSCTGAASYTWSTGSHDSLFQDQPGVTTIYTLSGNSAQGCRSEFNFKVNVEKCAGLTDREFQKYIVYPNPASQSIHVDLVTPEKMRIVSITGNIVFEGNADNLSVIDISSLDPGMYFISFCEQHNTRSFVKQ